MRKFRVAVLAGGPSPEHEVSLRSGENVAQNLDPRSLAPKLLVIGKDGRFPLSLEEIKEFDLAFVAMHGPFGEDGTIQALLEILGVPYTGSGPAASRLAMDKLSSKLLFSLHRLPTTPFRPVGSLGDLEEAARSLGFPLVVKPTNQGSSVGVKVVKEMGALKPAFRAAARFGPVLAEKYIRGREIQAGILGEEPLPLIEIRSKKEFFDLEAKYDSSLAEEITPAPLDPETTKKIQDLALSAFNLLGCRHFGRVDLFLAKDGRIYLSEVNTIPGLTEGSLFPKEAAVAGIPFPEVLGRIINMALRDAKIAIKERKPAR